MKKIIVIIFLSVLISTNVCAETTVLRFSPKSAERGTYTSLVQAIAVYQESCQNHSLGHYSSKMYDFDFRHNSNGECVVSHVSEPISLKVVLDDEATHVYTRSDNSVTGGSVRCTLYSEPNNMNYDGTCSIDL